MDFIVAAWIFKDDKVLLIKGHNLKQWLPVGGHVEEGEFFDEALIREVKEEVDLEIEFLEHDVLGGDVDQSRIRDMPMPFRMADKKGKAILMDYLAKPLTTDIAMQPEEISDYKWFTLEEIQVECKNPRVIEVAKKAFQKYYDF